MYPVPGMARRSIAFPDAKVAVFMDGCFWQGWPEHATQPLANSDCWDAKLQRNKVRDEETNDVLRSVGWRVLRFGEHEDQQLDTDRI